MEYIEVSLEIDPFKDGYADIVTAEISDLGFESYLTEEPYLKAYIPKEQFSEPHLKTVLSLIPETDFKVRYTLNLIPEQNWNALWESSFEPVVIDGRCTIKASFHKGLPRTRYTITIDPKMAFGTGHHQTTSLIIRSMGQAGAGHGMRDRDPVHICGQDEGGRTRSRHRHRSHCRPLGQGKCPQEQGNRPHQGPVRRRLAETPR